MGDVFIRKLPLPPTIKGLAVQDKEGQYNIYLNAHLPHEAHIETIQHEIQHIKNGDFSSMKHVKDVEK